MLLRPRVPCLALIACLLSVAGGSGQERSAVSVAGIGRVAWLAGCWESRGAGSTSEERWTPPRGGSMLGTSRTVRGDSLVEWEFVLLRERGDRLVYRAHPSGQATAEFVSSVVSADRVIFENPAHDFPQRIGYRIVGDTLRGWIDGMRNGRSRRVEFPYVRARCEAF
ncbi:MAG: DUF6265 family protein [Gemmatimonadota bacterium]|jgi:hypothetical protein